MTLDLSNTCMDDTVVSQKGIGDTICTINAGEPESISALGGSSLGSILADLMKTDSETRKRRGGRGNGGGRRNNNVKRGNDDRRHLQGGGGGVRITSVTFIEINAANDVINVDDTYSAVDFTSGSSFELSSISSTLVPNVDVDMQNVPSTQVLFMIGEDERGEEVRGRFVWRYTGSCDADAVTLEEGDELGWAVWDEVEDQLEELCPASGGGGGTPGPTRRVTSRPTVSIFI